MPGNVPGPAFGPPMPVPVPQSMEDLDPWMANALRRHKQGAFLYSIAWLAIGIAVVLLALDLALIINGVVGGSSGSSSGTLEMDLTLSSLGLLGGGLVVRGIAFSLMMHAGFLLKARLPPEANAFP